MTISVPPNYLKSEHHAKSHDFSFESIYTEAVDQDSVFNDLSSLIQSSLDGYNVCIFAYGQTGAGKTYTMIGGGEPQERGLLPRTVEMIFDRIKNLENLGWKFSLQVCFCEIYNNKMKLLSSEGITDIQEMVFGKHPLLSSSQR